MKKRLLISSLFLTAAVSAFAADSTHSSADVMVTLSSNAFGRIGMSREHLVAQLGEPSEKLSATVWVYWDFRVVGRPAGDRSDALVVVLNNNDRVSLLRLTERSLVEAARLKLRTNAAKATDADGEVKIPGASSGTLKTVGAGLPHDSSFPTEYRGVKPLLHPTKPKQASGYRTHRE